MIITWSLISWILTVLVVFVTTVYLYLQYRLTYLKRRGIPHEEPKFPKGNMTGKYISDMRRLYNKFRDDKSPVYGVYILFNPSIVVKDLDLVKNILIKDFHKFPERGAFIGKNYDPLSNHLFAMDKEGWKEQRSKLSPTFTSGKMKYMFSTVTTVTNQMAEVLAEVISKESGKEIEMKDYLARYGTDIIGNVAFGVECNSLKDPNAEFREFGRTIVETIADNFVSRMLKQNFPAIARFLKIRSQPIEVEKFCYQVVRETMNHRANGVKRNDFMDLLLEMKKSEQNPNGLDIDQIAAHTFVFFLAGFETTSTTMGFALYELCLNQEAQQKARDEIIEVSKQFDGKIPYESLEKMTYLENVINETLRMYPPVIELNRRCVTEYPLPNSDIVIEKNSRMIIPISYIHRDSNLYSEPDKFIPERFDTEEMKNRHPMSFIPFGDGPRNCIGLRFGKMQAKLGLATLLKNFIFTPGSKLTVPIELNENAFLRQSKHGLWFKLKKVES